MHINSLTSEIIVAYVLPPNWMALSVLSEETAGIALLQDLVKITAHERLVSLNSETRLLAVVTNGE